MIPKIIWQTHKNSNFPKEAINCIQSWIIKNPEYEWYFMDDDKCEQFIKDHFSQEFYNMYQSLPYGVMKSDTWRIAIVYVYGGLYADLDTFCMKEIDTWIENYDLVVSEEPPAGTISNFCFAAKPKHPALLMCLNELINNYNHKNYLDKLEPSGTPIQNFGQHAFHLGIKNYLNSNLNDNKMKMFSADDNAFSPCLNEKTIVHHQTASIMWSNEYDSWRKQQFKSFGY